MNLEPYSIKVPIDFKTKFPDCCLICGKQFPDASTIIFGRDGLRGVVFWAGWFTQKIPCCKLCGWKYQLWRAWNFVRTLIIAGACFAFGIIYLQPRMEGWKCGLIVLGMICIGFLAVFIWNRFFPPPFHVTRTGDWLEYEFREEPM